jgi:hypothetical protein
VQCFQGRHQVLAYGLAIPGLVLVGLGLPLASACLLAANKQKLYTDLRFAEKVSARNFTRNAWYNIPLFCKGL